MKNDVACEELFQRCFSNTSIEDKIRYFFVLQNRLGSWWNYLFQNQIQLFFMLKIAKLAKMWEKESVLTTVGNKKEAADGLSPTEIYYFGIL